jgi:hypothetical protein
MRYYARRLRQPVGGNRGLSNLFTWISRSRDWYLSQPTLSFEAVTLGLAVLFGLVVMPVLIYLAGSVALNAYANGGLFALYGDFFKGLVELRPSCWIVVAGPFVFLTVFRFFRLILRKI